MVSGKGREIMMIIILYNSVPLHSFIIANDSSPSDAIIHSQERSILSASETHSNGIYSNVPKSSVPSSGNQMGPDELLPSTSNSVYGKPKTVIENDYMNRQDVAQSLLQHQQQQQQLASPFVDVLSAPLGQSAFDQSHPTSSTLLNGSTLQFDDNDDYAVIDSTGSNTNLHDESILKVLLPHLDDGQIGKLSSEHFLERAGAPAGRRVPPESKVNAALKQSLTESKARIANLKRELDANFNLLAVIDKYYYTRGDNSEASAIEV